MDYCKSLCFLLREFLSPFKQILFIVFFSLLPIFLSAANKASHEESLEYWDSVVTLLDNGSIFIYVSTLLAPYFYSLVFQNGFRNRIFVMLILLLALYSLVIGALLYSEFIVSEWGGTSFPSYIEWSVILTAIITWYYTLYERHCSSRANSNEISIQNAVAEGVKS
jgi:hypothetical protein